MRDLGLNPFKKSMTENPDKAFEVLFTPQPADSDRPPKGERFQGPGMWYEELFPVHKDGSVMHVTQTWMNKEGKVTRAFSNMFDGITYAPGVTRTTGGDRWGFGSESYCPWDEIEHFIDAYDNVYEKV